MEAEIRTFTWRAAPDCKHEVIMLHLQQTFGPAGAEVLSVAIGEDVYNYVHAQIGGGEPHLLNQAAEEAEGRSGLWQLTSTPLFVAKTR